jgi:rhodanese-related sulfurtransferase
MDIILGWVAGVVIVILLVRSLRSRRQRGRVPGLRAAGAVIVDVRTKDEYAQGHVEGSINAPLASLPAGLEKVDRSKPLIVCCASGIRSEAAVGALRRAGYLDVVNGGSWRDLR